MPLLAAVLVSCAFGIRGRPLPPLIILPAVVSDLSAVRLGDEVHLEFTVPEANDDGSRPPDIERVDIYAVTTLPVDNEPLVLDAWIEDAEPVFTFDIVVPVEPELAGEDDTDVHAVEAVAEEGTYAPGDLITAVEPLTPELVEAVEIEREDEEEEEDEDAESEAAALEAAARQPPPAPLLSPPLPRAPRRTYVAVAVSRRNRQSAVFAAPPVPVDPAPDPPGPPVLTYTETSIDIEWTPPDTARLPVQQSLPAADETEDSAGADTAAAVEGAGQDAPDEPAAAESVAEETGADESEPAATPPVLQSTTLLPPQTPSRYDVYDVTPAPPAADDAEGGEPDAEDVEDGDGADDGGILRPLTEQPLAATSHTGVEAMLGGERCFAVRTVDEVDPVDRLQVRSAASETVCVQLQDVFPPAAPTGLVAVSGAGAISLTWNANAEADFAGYIVLRGSGPEAELEALTAEPITVTNYRDAAVEAGVDYVYAIQAVDGADPPNLSEASEQVAEQGP